MNNLILRFSRQIALCAACLVALQASEAVAMPVQEPQQQQPARAQQAQTASAVDSSSLQGVVAEVDLPQAPEPAAQQTPEQAQPGLATRSQDQQQPNAQQPVGTAAGPYSRPGGVAGSRAAGAAIAPAKQKRVKAIVIRVALIAAGAAAVGAVVGLSKESSSRP